jgi:signal transduction histidine kinase
MPSILDVFTGLAVWCGLAKPTIFLLTGITSGILAGVILYLRWQVLPEERWVRYFGWAFAVFAFQYIIQAPTAWMANNGIISHAPWAQILALAAVSSQVICSPANNLCFLGAAKALLGDEHPLRLPWVGIALITSLFAMGPQTFWYRVPDACFSIVCLSWLGLAMFRNFSPRRRPFLALTSLAGALLYGMLNIIYALNPLVAESIVGSRLTRGLGDLDAMVFAVAFTLKLLLFLAALLLIIKLLLMLSPAASRELLMELRAKRTEYLEADGIVRALCLSVEADVAALYIRLPSRRTPLISERRWQWDANGGEARTFLTRFLPGSRYWQTAAALRRVNAEPRRDRQETFRQPLPSEESVIGNVLRTAEVFSSQNIQDTLRSRKLTHETTIGAMAVIPIGAMAVVPIQYHGAVIGCLELAWREPLGYSATALQRIRVTADWLAPAVHTRRQLEAVDMLTERFQSLEIAQTDDAGRPVAIASLVKEVHDILSPVETTCHIDFGFRGDSVVCSDSGVAFPETRGYARHTSAALEEKRAYLTVKNPATGEDVAEGLPVKVGEIVLSLAKGCDPDGRPALAVDDLHRGIVAALVTGAVFDLARLELGRLHNRLQIDLNSKALVSVQPWFETVQATARGAGLSWAVAELPDPDQKHLLLGNDDDCAFVTGVISGRASQDPLPSISLSEPRRGAWHVLALPLEEKRGRLWLGVERRGFGPELELPSPWRTFVHRLAVSADLGLVRIEKQRDLLQAQRLQVIALQVEMSRLLMHKLRNVTVAFAGGVQHLDELLPEVGEPIAASVHEQVKRLKRSAADFRDLTTSILRPVPRDQRVIFPLADAVASVKLEYEEVLASDGIELRGEIDPDLLVTGTLETASIALSNLVTNAAESRAKNIAIGAEIARDSVLCHVTDDGPGIPAHLQEKIFELTFTTRPEGTGLGLPLARSVIERVGGKLTLAASRKGYTRFTIHLPKASREI